ncbi:MAG: hypothetical protein KDD72_06455 [Anaerolineales bacterium]|nr:hypothetical protein [Anaerolineales bacterium]
MYIDPNTGGVLFQALAAVFAIFSATVLIFSSKIRASIAKFRRKNNENQEEENKEN